MSRSLRDYTVACICPMGVELAPVRAMLDQTHPGLPTQRDQNSYFLGEIAGHNVVIAVLPEIGTNAAATVATQLLNDFPSVKFGLLVGIGGGIPDLDHAVDIRLGDVVVNKPTNTFGGVVQYDMGKETRDGFERTGTLNKPPAFLRAAVQQLIAQHELEDSQIPQHMSSMFEKFPKMKEKYGFPGREYDQLFLPSYHHQDAISCEGCDMLQTVARPDRPASLPYVHYGTIGSANKVIKNAVERDRLKGGDSSIICVEMEAAGLMDWFPCLVIRGICDYADSHKNKRWQPYAAATAAAYMKELLSVITPQQAAKEALGASVVAPPNYNRNLNLLDAPDMGDDFFFGREQELSQIEAILMPDRDSSTRKVLKIGGMGGIGKTQLAINYAKRHRRSYASVFWINATSETALKTSLRRLAPQMLSSEAVGPLDHLDDEQLWTRISLWLSEEQNSRWLLIYDNYDDPQQFQIEQYFPFVAHGAIIITTRQPDLVIGAAVKLLSMTNIEDSLRILATRSRRPNTFSDPGARRLAERLAGFPLALATAGASLSHSPVSFSRYLEQYEAKWSVVAGSAHELPDYRTRTLYTTWNLSLVQIEQNMPLAAKLMTFLAYFDHQDLWYDLFRRGSATNKPEWFLNLTKDEFMFEQAMKTLIRYCLVESHHQTGSFSLHVCVHDWILNGIGDGVESSQYWLAFNCVAGHLPLEDWHNLSSIRYRRIAPHAARLGDERFQQAANSQQSIKHELQALVVTARLLHVQGHHQAAERMYFWALASHEQELGPDHPLTFETINNIGALYYDQGKLAQMEQILASILPRMDKAQVSGHEVKFRTVINLGIVYSHQGKLVEAERTFGQALAGAEQQFGPNHVIPMLCSSHLGRLLQMQGRIAEAEQMYTKVLCTNEKILRSAQELTLTTLYNLGSLYRVQGKMHLAEQTFHRVLAEAEENFGLDHRLTLSTTSTLGSIFRAQGRLAEAEQMRNRAMPGVEQAFRPNNPLNLEGVQKPERLYQSQGNLEGSTHASSDASRSRSDLGTRRPRGYLSLFMRKKA